MSCPECGDAEGACACGTRYSEVLVEQQGFVRAPAAGKKLQNTYHPYYIARLREHNQKAVRLHVRIQKWRVALGKLCGQLRLQSVIQDAALRLVQAQLSRRFQGTKESHKRLGCACLLIAASQHSLGLTLDEVACRCEVKANLLQRMVWKVCRDNGVQVSRSQANAEALVGRICQHLNVAQAGGVTAYAGKVMSIANQGWVCTGRRWGFVVAAAFMLAAQAFYYHIEVQEVARFLCIGAGTIQKRLEEIKKVILSVMQHLPWGHMIEADNMHVYLPFALQHWDVLAPAAPLLRKQKLDAQQRRHKALLALTESKLPLEGPESRRS